MALNGVSTPAVAAAGVGALVLWSAIKGMKVTSGLRSLLGGKQPSSSPTDYPITSATIIQQNPDQAATAGATGSAIADDAMRYYGSGTKYSWGGGSPKGWDCSGFCNYVIGKDLGLAIPGSRSGSYSGHGPVTMQWALFGTGIKRNQVSAGDLVVWPIHHMGIAISNSQMINCPGPNGTPAPIVSPIDENIGGPVVYRRISTAGLSTGTTQAPGTTTAGGRG